MAPNNWDPLIFAHEQPSEQCTVRVKRDLAEFNANPPPGIFVAAEENNISKVHAIIAGPVGTPYEGGFFQFFLKFPTDYPMSPPRVRHITTDAGRVLFNQHFYRSEETPGASDQYNDLIRHETMRVAVCDQVEACLKETIKCPPSLSSQILKLFLESYDKYEYAVSTKLHLTDRQMKDPYTRVVSKYQYETLLSRLKSLREQVDKKNEEAAKAAAEAAA
ncbi:hypothetical protein HPB51_001805 [Rhipicephalus microplus]|uniref:Ubiquitin-conjugating enzyme E2 Z n=1 Tax=Rhipicephalus microplus TaxID=6941 RepID=A0A9J6EWL8_RHIMP|nr:hypothetical protein HPB51_001805 [Rhipicephalus microplus]